MLPLYMHTYIQSTGEWLDPTGKLLATGYSGCPDCKNNPKTESRHNEGPIPAGLYTIYGPPFDSPDHGKYVLRLDPDPQNEMYGRAGFLIHGDKISAPGTASEGCIIQPRWARESIWASPDHKLQVVSENYQPDLTAGDL